MTNESRSNAIIGNTLRIIASGEYHPGAELTQKMASYIIELEQNLTDMAVQLANAESKCAALAAENAALKAFGGKLGDMHNDLNGEGTGIQGRAEVAIQQVALEAAIEEFDAINTSATDAFLAEVRASAIPEGYVLVPQQIFLEPSDIESICSQCGDGNESGYGDFTDGLLWVGSIQRDDGSIAHGLHISSADYSEEGGITICEFDAQLRKRAAV